MGDFVILKKFEILSRVWIEFYVTKSLAKALQLRMIF